MTIRVLAILALIMLSYPAQANSALCFFWVPSEPSTYDLEFAGGDGFTQIYYHGAGSDGPVSLPFELIDFDSGADRVHLTYKNLGDTRLPPSFTLIGSGDKVRVLTSVKELVGTLDCEFWELEDAGKAAESGA